MSAPPPQAPSSGSTGNTPPQPGRSSSISKVVHGLLEKFKQDDSVTEVEATKIYDVWCRVFPLETNFTSLHEKFRKESGTALGRRGSVICDKIWDVIKKQMVAKKQAQQAQLSQQGMGQPGQLQQGQGQQIQPNNVQKMGSGVNPTQPSLQFSGMQQQQSQHHSQDFRMNPSLSQQNFSGQQNHQGMAYGQQSLPPPPSSGAGGGVSNAYIPQRPMMQNSIGGFASGNNLNQGMNPTFPSTQQQQSMTGSTSQQNYLRPGMSTSTTAGYRPDVQYTPAPGAPVASLSQGSQQLSQIQQQLQQHQQHQHQHQQLQQQPNASSTAQQASTGAPGALAGHQSAAPMPAQPMVPRTPQEEIDAMTEKGDVQTEFKVGDNRLQTAAFDLHSLSTEDERVRRQTRDSVPNTTLPPMYMSINEIINPSQNNLVDGLWIEQLLGQVNHALSTRVTIRDSAKRLLSDAMQQHLRSVLESGIASARGRIQASASRKFKILRENFANGLPVNNRILGEVGFKWGPDVSSILAREEEKARYLVQRFLELDRLKLLKDAQELIVIKPAGSKRKAEETLEMSWKAIDEQAMRDGNLTLEQIAEINAKHQLLTPFQKDASGLRTLPTSSAVAPLDLQSDPDVPFVKFTERTTLEVTPMDLRGVLRDFKSVSGEKIVCRSLAKSNDKK